MALESAKAKLEGKFAFEDLPADRSDSVWDKIEATYKLTLQELSALKNERCKPQGSDYLMAEIRGVKRTLSLLQAENAILKEPALKLFAGMDGCGSKTLTDGIKNRVRDNFKICAICREPNIVKLSVAHILPGDPAKLMQYKHTKMALDSVNPPRFKTPYEFRSDRNCILLCGTNTNVGTCHWAFDNHQVGIIYNPLTRDYDISWFEETGLSQVQLAATKLYVPPDTVAFQFRPFRRGFAFHALEGIHRHALDLNSENVQQVIQNAEFSRVAEEKKVDDMSESTALSQTLSGPNSEIGNLEDFEEVNSLNPDFGKETD